MSVEPLGACSTAVRQQQDEADEQHCGRPQEEMHGVDPGRRARPRGEPIAGGVGARRHERVEIDSTVSGIVADRSQHRVERCLRRDAGQPVKSGRRVRRRGRLQTCRPPSSPRGPGGGTGAQQTRDAAEQEQPCECRTEARSERAACDPGPTRLLPATADPGVPASAHPTFLCQVPRLPLRREQRVDGPTDSVKVGEVLRDSAGNGKRPITSGSLPGCS